MIPSVLAQQLKQGIGDFIRTTFPVSTPFFQARENYLGMVEQLLAEDGGLFKGPYLSIQLPFRKGRVGADYFPDVPLPFSPHLHQENAFKRLISPNPMSTLVATGTGSGKTESFLIPILDHCYKNRGESGIKAILIYPMNALATDQAKRLAKTVFNNSRLKGNITAGLFVGQSESDPQVVMSEGNIITNKDILRDNPPDILLTNYKMLDYLLIRPKDNKLWRNNIPETLRYLVVDELHTFDGAQGTDLACLIRRLKSRLDTPKKYLACVGTSATIGREESVNYLRDYANKIFDEPFDEGSVITEDRLNVGEYLEDSVIRYADLPLVEQDEKLEPDSYQIFEDYIRSQYELWFSEPPPDNVNESEWRVDLGKKLKGHLLFQNLLRFLKGEPKDVKMLVGELRQVSNMHSSSSEDYFINIIYSLCALISHARKWQEAPGEGETAERKAEPFLYVRVQLWLRELRRMVAEVKSEPHIRFADDLKKNEGPCNLPIIHCRDCNATGWGGVKREGESVLEDDLKEFYISFFGQQPSLTYLFPVGEGPLSQQLDGMYSTVCGECGHLGDDNTCSSCGNDSLIQVFIPNNRVRKKDRVMTTQDCPFCSSKKSLTILGSRAASLASVLIGQVFATPYNDDKKLITFSDSVQDAAHRAGFFAARTYQFNFRAALQQAVMDNGEGKSLTELPSMFVDYWKSRMEVSAYIATFLAPNMEWLHDFSYLKEHDYLPQNTDLLQHVNNRVGWEIYSEYGYKARIGRTLERSSASTLFPGGKAIKNATTASLELLRNEIGELREIDESGLTQFLCGIVMHLKIQGAIHHQALDTYIERKGDTYSVNRIPYMPAIYPGTRAPVFLTNGNIMRFEKILSSTNNKKKTWLEGWVDKCFSNKGGSVFVSAYAKQIYEIILKDLENSQLLEKRDVQGNSVWGIRPEALYVSQSVKQFRCTKCAHNVSVAQQEVESWKGIPCMRSSCLGVYEQEPDKSDYYWKLYTTADIERIVAEEHTGLLDRDTRERVEKTFMVNTVERKPWYPNMLSATPTLEMGVDIGDLSSVLLCSVPPLQANYLQRIGRTGRRDGNSLNITIANGRPHDLYFYADPTELMVGDVEPPGVFLNASAVLERQFTAFCFDSWVNTGIKAHELPARIGQVLNNVDKKKQDVFPYTLIEYIETHRTELLDKFLVIFKGSLDEESIKHVKFFVEGDSAKFAGIEYQIINKLTELSSERESYKRRVKSLHVRIKKKENDPAKDPDIERHIDNMRRERTGLQELIKSLSDKDTLNFFTDEGLLPNYAFPEAGVLLKSVIYRRRKEAENIDKENKEKGKYECWTYEYERSGTAAISELAPGNSFYAGGRKVEIDQVDLNLSTIEIWRLCSNCAHSERIDTGDIYTSCPHCGDEMWSDSGQKRQMLRMRQVFASDSDQRSRISDDSDDRTPVFYNKQMLVDFQEGSIRDAYYIENEKFPFGFEFIAQADFREINFGERDEQSENVIVAGVEMPRKGFTICRHCGMVQKNNTFSDDRRQQDGQQHAFSCNARDKESNNNVLKCLYLYREFSSEAIRLLLPVTTFSGSDRKLHSFIAALQLGLKRKYGGSVDHLKVMSYEEPVADSVYKTQYLMLYDTVPGGTGYLKQLMRSTEPLLEVLQIAHDVLTKCACNADAEKDGCYRCLYAYRGSYDMPTTSRDTAIELIEQILECRNQLSQVTTLKDINVNALFDSELEIRFIEALRRYRARGYKITIKPDIVNQKPGFFLKVDGQAYFVEPQVVLNQSDGITVPCKADFVFWPARSGKGVKPIVVFTDGFLYHKNRIARDTAQRLALVQSDCFQVWSLTWKDVEHQFKPQGSYYVDYLNGGIPPEQSNNLSKYIQLFDVEKMKPLHKENSFDWLVQWLAYPDEDAWGRYACVRALLWLNPKAYENAEAVKEFDKNITRVTTESIREFFAELTLPLAYGNPWVVSNTDEGRIQVQVVMPHDAVRNRDLRACGIVLHIDDEVDVRKDTLERAWIGFWRLYNLFQFLPLACCTTILGLKEFEYDLIVFDRAQKAMGPEEVSTIDADWDEVNELVNDTSYELIKLLIEKAVKPPEVGFEIQDKQGEIIGEAELAWPSHELAVLDEDQIEYQSNFESMGWYVYKISEWQEISAELVNRLSK